MKKLLTVSILLFTVAVSRAALVNRYSFSETNGTVIHDTVGGADGTLQGGAVLSNGAVTLDGSSGFVSLPGGLVSGLTDVTFEAWVTPAAANVWGRVFDFGSNSGGVGGQGTGQTYVFLTTDSGSGTLRFAYSTNANAGENPILDGPVIANNLPYYLAVVYSPSSNKSALYLNGSLVSTGTALGPLNLISDVNDWLGKSQWHDPYFRGSIDEFRIWSGALTAAQIGTDYTNGPDKFLFGPIFIFGQPQNTTVTEERTVTWVANVDGVQPWSVQWLRNGLPLAGQTNLTLSFIASLADNNAAYQFAASNVFNGTNYSVLSSNAILTVVPDTTPPVLVSAQSASTNGVQVVFTEAIRGDTAVNPANFSLTGPGGVIVPLGISQDATGLIITLSTPPLVVGSIYSVTVTGLKDLAGNSIAAGSQASFMVSVYTLQDIGSPSITGMFLSSTNGWLLSAGGGGIGGTVDQFSFAHQTVTGDFDVQVRLGSLGLSDAMATAGLMARDGLGSNALFAATLATPGPGGCFFESRTVVGGSAATSGFFPANYPNTWLRLKRAGNVFSGYASVDGRSWAQLGTSTFTASSALEVGIAASSHNVSESTMVAFDNAGNTTNTGLATSPLPFEPPGPSSRRSGLTFTEIMYHPQSGTNTNDLEFVEIYNSDIVFEDISGYRLSGSINYTFPQGTVIPAGGYLVVAANPSALQTAYGISGVLGPFTNNLPNGNGSVLLLNDLGSVLLQVDYDSVSGWPAAADGAGHSLVLRRPSFGEGDPRAWASSDIVGGSPGAMDPYGVEPLRPVVINEILLNPTSPAQGSIELFNTGSQTLDLTGCVLTDDPKTNKYIIANVTIPARGYAVFTTDQLGFSPSAAGRTIYLKNPALTRVLDAIRYEPQENGISFGRYPDGNAQWYRLAGQTFGTANSAQLLSQVGINELMQEPISGLDDDQYVELYNQGTNAVNLGGWSFVSGISYTFPANTIIPANGYLVAAKNITRLLADYSNLNSNNTVGNYSGKLSHNGERIALAKPASLVTTNAQGMATTNVVAIVVDEVTYGVDGRWGEWAGGGGSSLELKDPHSDKRFAANWADSDETMKAPWTVIQRTDTIDLGMGTGTSGNGIPNRVEFFSQGAGEFLVDDVEALSNGGTNYITNPGFESGTNGWAFQGTFRSSGLETTLPAFSGANSLHVRATGGGDTGADRIRTSIATMPIGGTNKATLRARVRWLKGDKNFLMRIRGNWLECAGEMTVPLNLGTPGAPNSRLMTNAGPAISEVSHFPVLPAALQSVTVTTRISDPDGVSGVLLFYRIDPAASYSIVTMRDNGTSGDAWANDGVYTATIPGQGAGTMVAFFVQATDANSPTAAKRFPDDAPTRECLVNFGEPLRSGSLGNYHLWLTQSNITYWNNREKNSNEKLDATFVYGNWRVIYNAATEYSGSPFHTPNYNGAIGSFACNYNLEFTADEPCLGDTHFLLESQTATDGSIFNNDASAQAETTAHWMAHKLGIRPDNRRYVVVYMNGQQRGMIYWDYQKPRHSLLKEYFPDDNNGILLKIDDWFEFDDAGSTFDSVTAKLLNYTVNGNKRTERYRWAWEPSGNNGPNDFADFFTLVDAMNAPSPQPYTSAVTNLVDVRKWMRMLALEHMSGDWDSYGYRRGKNMYVYKPASGPWEFLLYDIQLIFGKSSDIPTQSLFDVGNTNDPTAGDPLMVKMYNHPPFVRAYWSAMQDLVNGPMLPSNYGPLMDARSAALQANNVPVEDASSIKSWIDARRSYILTQIPQAAFSVNGANPITSTSNSLTLTGIAPIGVEQISINGTSYALTWTSVTNWSLKVPLLPGTNTLALQAQDADGNAIANGSSTIIGVYNGSNVPPAGNIVFNEIMHHPAVSGAEFVELLNTHSNCTFDLSNWRVDGLGYTFPAGSLLPPGGFLVLAKDRYIYAQTYGATNPVFDQFSGTLSATGETLTLIEPGITSSNDVAVAKVLYGTEAPWPSAASQPGVALQLIDPLRDNWREGNWTTCPTNPPPPTPQWVHVTTTGTVSSSILYIYLQAAGDLYLDDLSLVYGTVPESGPNLLANGDFESTFPGSSWNISANLTGSTVSTNFKHSGSASLHVVATAGGTTQSSSIYQVITPTLTNGASCALGFWYLQNTNGVPFVIRLSNSGIGSTNTPSFSAASPNLAATPGFTNSVATNLPPFAPLWINEVQASNLTGVANSAGQRMPWIEIYNPGTNIVALTNLYLAGNYTNLTQWAFPSNAVINPGQFKVIFVDGLTNLSTTAEWHANFVLTNPSGSVALSRVYNGQAQVLDYVDYSGLPANYSYGSFPDGQSFVRQQFFVATPGSPNNGIAASPHSYIAYAPEGAVYSQDFDSLPNPGSTSVNTANPVTVNGITYSLANPFDFEYPAIAAGNIGGLGNSALGGWYGMADPAASVGARFGATYGDQTTGGILSFGQANSSNRALGLLATSTTGYTGFGVKFINATTNSLNCVTLQATGEVWRQSNLPKTLQCFYFIDSTATNLLTTNVTAYWPALNVSLPTVAADSGGVAVNGTLPANQINLAVTNVVITNWPPGTALWIVWKMADSTGKAQGLAIDNLSFSASTVQSVVSRSLAIATSDNQALLSWQAPAGPAYQLECKTNLDDSAWIPLGSPRTGTGGAMIFTNSIDEATSCFFRLSIVQ